MLDDAWEKIKDPNFFGDAPVLGPSGGIVSIDIQALRLLADVLEDEYINDKLVKALRKNNLYYTGFCEHQWTRVIRTDDFLSHLF